MKLKFLDSRVTIIVLIILTLNNYVHCETKKTLEQKRNEYKKKIELANDLLEKNKEKQNTTIANLKLIIHKIDQRKELVRSIESEINYLNERIENNDKVIVSLKSDLEKLKLEYEKLIFYAYKNRKTTNLWLFIFASENFNQAYRRYKYLIEYTKYRKKQKEVIVSISEQLTKKNKELGLEKKKKQDILLTYSAENNKLKREITEKEILVNSLKENEKKLKKEIETNKKREKEIEREIAKIIKEEQRRSKTQISQDKVIGTEFKNNYGKLLWPVKSGVVISEYGEHFHPVLKEVKINNRGIDISTNRGSDVFAVYDGEVSNIAIIPGTNSTVIIKHGNFYSVYQNLIALQIKKGTKMEKGDIIGKVYTDESTNATILHFQIWDGMKTIDPLNWIKK